MTGAPGGGRWRVPGVTVWVHKALHRQCGIGPARRNGPVFVIFGRFNGLRHLAAVMNVRTEALGGGNSDEQGPDRPQASPAEPAAEEVS
jgi:hypothetical protein